MRIRFRGWGRRLSARAPRMVIRSALPWPLRWVIVAVVLGFCAAIGLWAFEFGRDIAGLDRGSKEEIQRLHTEVERLQGELDTVKAERDSAQSVANTADALVATEKASSEKLLEQVKQLEAANESLRDDLGFFEKLIPSSHAETLAIRGIQVDALESGLYKWQVLVIQPVKGAPELSGKLELVFAGTLDGKPWSMTLPEGAIPIKVTKYGRFEGRIQAPSQAVLKNVTVRVLDGTTVRATQSQRL